VGEVSIESERLAYVQKLDEAPRRIVELLSRIDGIQRVSLFGSYARGRRDLFTDLDVLVVWETNKPLLERAGFLHSLLDIAVDVDVICYTPAEFERIKDRLFLRRALSEEVVLLEKRPA
jgi:predicted nucleotidyltransferase